MEIITVGLGYKALLLNSLFIAVLPVALSFSLEYLFTKRFSGVGLLFGVALYVLLQGGLHYQTKGRVSVNNGVLKVQSGFYKAAWSLEGMSISASDASSMGAAVRISGIDIYDFRAGWFQFDGARVFFLTTSGQIACVKQTGKVVLCLDRGVIDRIDEFI